MLHRFPCTLLHHHSLAAYSAQIPRKIYLSFTKWEYGKFPYDRASFTYDSTEQPWTLNNFNINREWGDKHLPDSFNTTNIMNIKEGMSADDILKMFGTPVNVSEAVCGAKTWKTWVCTVWEYGKPPFERASFTFSGNPNSLILNNFEVNK